MGAKRAVAGRSQPYDVLLAAYQKKAIGRPQSNNNNNNTNNTNTNNNHNLNNNEDYFDSDEEVENIMQALRSNHPTPLAQKPNFYVKRKRQCFRLRDILLEAITPKEKEPSTSASTLSSSTQDNTSIINNAIYNNKPTTPYSSTFPTSASSSSIHRQQSSTLLSPTNMNYSGIYMDGMSPTSPATSIASTYSIR
ncbi:hypothetical protein BJ944DRAFT_168714 [Cunninghamella echinulata]|nr:hypothetical protein BJ944DRAFT_168714 [Cunninghamella echinulata]